MLTVSVALATYNGSAKINELLASLAAQSLRPVELLVGDDGSVDGTVPQVEEFSRRAPFPVRVDVNPVRLGYGDNFLSVARRCSGDIVAFCDQDDVWEENKLWEVVDAFESCGGSLVAHHARVIDADGRDLGRSFPRYGGSGLFTPQELPLQCFPGFAISVRREVLTIAGYLSWSPEVSRRFSVGAHDVWVWLLAGCIGDTLVLPDELVRYRQHANLFGDDHVAKGQMILRALQTGGQTYGRRAQGAAGKAEYLRMLAEMWRDEGLGSFADNAEARANRYTALSEGFAARHVLYGSKTTFRALQEYRRMVLSSRYTPLIAEGMVSRSAPIKDLLSLMARRLPIEDAPMIGGPGLEATSQEQE